MKSFVRSGSVAVAVVAVEVAVGVVVGVVAGAMVGASRSRRRRGHRLVVVIRSLPVVARAVRREVAGRGDFSGVAAGGRVVRFWMGLGSG